MLRGYYYPRNISHLLFTVLSDSIMLIYRHVPGSQPPFSLNPYPDQNKQDTSFISIAAYCIYIPLSRPTQFCPLPLQYLEKKCTVSWILDPGGVPSIFVVFKSFHQIRNPVMQNLYHGQQGGPNLLSSKLRKLHGVKIYCFRRRIQL